MTLPELLKEIWEQTQAAAAALTPAALGSAVSQAWRPGLTWRQRLVQWIVGISVSYYVTLGATEILNLTPFTAQACSFVIAMIAFEVTPLFTRAAGDLVAELPALIKARLGRGK
ncbi:MAG TPA: hypothetical protein VIG90_00355 [Pedomonas sp.]|uniref:hypothetical protein n=1 Tax=Pedomonas sp. TaxID=2976421 RepID=UPI002F40FD0A